RPSNGTWPEQRNIVRHSVTGCGPYELGGLVWGYPGGTILSDFQSRSRSYAEPSMPSRISSRNGTFTVTAIILLNLETMSQHLRGRVSGVIHLPEGPTMMLLAKFLKDQSAATAIEYGLIAAGICVAIVVVVQTTGTNLNATFTTVANALKRREALSDGQAKPGHGSGRA